ncbi:MAG: hypothetical protein NTU62_10450 [Spirochaetes bacterium]|nr:hypothetical protein [Spirochaetota bacterium]
MKRKKPAHQDEMPGLPDSNGPQPFPDGTRPRHPSDYQPEPEHNVIHLMGIVSVDSWLFTFAFRLKGGAGVPFVREGYRSTDPHVRSDLAMKGYFTPPEPDSDGVWRFTVESNNPDHAHCEFLKNTRGIRLESIGESSEPLGKQPYFSFFTTPLQTDKRRKDIQKLAPSAADRLKNTKLLRFIKREALRYAKGDLDLLDDLMQEAFLRVCGVETDDLEHLKAEASRAIQAARGVEKRRHDRPSCHDLI